jgi:hypothetical protein
MQTIWQASTSNDVDRRIREGEEISPLGDRGMGKPYPKGKYRLMRNIGI